jgi:hypothetical protein
MSTTWLTTRALLTTGHAVTLGFDVVTWSLVGGKNASM